MKVLHLNVRLQEGGAARVAVDLHRHLLNAGIESRFAYGWGEKGGISSAEKSVPACFRIGRRFQVAGNILLHRAVGIDLLPPGGGRKLTEAVRWADVVHLHVIHSYFLPFGRLVKELLRANKPVVWTAHDYWMLTGRCAFTEGCEGWRKGCGVCPTMKNYPPAGLDLSASQFKVRRRLLAGLGPRMHVVTPSEFVAQAVKDGLPDICVSVIPNWLDSEFQAAIKDIGPSNGPVKSRNGKIKVAVIANDLSDPTKVDRALVNRLSNMNHIEVQTIGRNSPFSGERIINHGRIASRRQMVETIATADAALFTSDKDTFGLVMIESLACGVPVFAVQSKASTEVLGRLGISTMSKEKIIAALSEPRAARVLLDSAGADIRQAVASVYGYTKAVESYCAIYESLASGRKTS